MKFVVFSCKSEQSHLKSDLETAITKCKRNASNDIIECLFTVAKDNKECKITYEYEYNNAGNWIKQTKFYDSQIVNIVVRNIEFYTA